MKRALVWIRRDIRSSDHTALAAACAVAEKVAVVFVFDPVILDALEDRDDKRLTFIHRSLQELDEQLQSHGSRLIVAHGDPVDKIPLLATELKAKAVFTNHDYEPYAIERDDRVRMRLLKAGVEFQTFKDQVVFEREEILNQSGGPFRVYSPYSRAWMALLTPADFAERSPDFSRLSPAGDLDSTPKLEPLSAYGFQPSSLWLTPGESGARNRLTWFRGRIDAYGEMRDFPAAEHTSGLSVHLRHGTISIRECVRMALEGKSPGRKKWLNELIWREFYMMILAVFPHVVHGSFRPEYDRVDWPGTDAHFYDWCAGQTGYPLVDAAMRCFNETGWMHNRLRMVVAMFLTKDLLVDWRRGEAYFARKLLDFDLAQNNGGWQWSASTGVDAQPYFRVFNPLLQSRKFDPDGEFIRKWCPELAELPNELLHWPLDAGPLELVAAGIELGVTYPHPIVDHRIQKDLAVELLGSVKPSSAG